MLNTVLIPQVNVVLTRHPENFAIDGSLYKKTATDENADLWSPVPDLQNSSYTRGSGNTAEQGLKGCKSQGIREFPVHKLLACPPAMSEAMSTKSHHHSLI